MSEASWRVSRLAVLLLGGLLACTMAPAADSMSVELKAAIQRWVAAVNSQDVATLEKTMTGDVELSGNATTVAGRNAAIRELQEAAARGRLIATTREIGIAGDIGWHVVGIAQVQKNGDVQARGQALEIWKRVNGEWKLHRRMAAGSQPPADLLKRPPANEPVLDQPAQ